MAVRNYWIQADIDGRLPLAGGPRSKEGGIDVTIKMRDGGAITTPLRIKGFAQADGTLDLCVYFDGELIAERKAQR